MPLYVAGRRFSKRVLEVPPLVVRLNAPRLPLSNANVPSPPTVFLITTRPPRLVFSNVDVTVSPGSTETEGGG